MSKKEVVDIDVSQLSASRGGNADLNNIGCRPPLERAGCGEDES